MHSSVSESSGRTQWVGVIVLGLCALLELGLAAWVVILGGDGRSCPLSSQGFSCATLIRPRLGQLGPLPLSTLAVGGGLASLVFTQLAALRALTPPLARWGALALALGAGFALGVQAWSWTAVGGLCPYCLGIALSAVGAAAAAAWVARSTHEAPAWHAAVTFATALALTLPLAWLHGSGLAADDAARRKAVLEAAGSRQPTLLLVVRDGCPYCEAFLLDTLGDPRVLEQLNANRAVEVVKPDDPRLAKVKLKGTPTLLCPGSSVKPLAGLASVAETLEWMQSVEEE